MAGPATMKILIDRNIVRNAITHRSVERPRSLRWGDRDVTADVPARQAFPPRGDEEFRIDQMPFLATVTELARAGRLELFTSFELQMERMRQRERGTGLRRIRSSRRHNAGEGAPSRWKVNRNRRVRTKCGCDRSRANGVLSVDSE